MKLLDRIGVITVLAAAVAVSSSSFATTYYVTTTGSDTNNGRSLEKAFRHIQHAANQTEPGDIVMVGSGTFQETKGDATGYDLLISRSGSPGANITYEPYPGTHPIIASLNDATVYTTVQITGSYIRFNGFEVIGHAQYVTLAHATSIAAQEEKAYLASVKANKANPKVPIVYPSDTMTNGACVFVTQATHVVVSNTLAHDCSAIGIGAQDADYVSFLTNVVFNTSWWSVYDTTGIAIHYSLNSDNYSGYKNYILNNISHDSGNTQPYFQPNVGGGVPTDGNGFIVDSNQHTSNGKPYLGRTLVMGNVSYNNGGTGMHAYLSSHVDMFNNTAFNNNECPVPGSNCGSINNGQILSNVSDDVNIYNNVIYTPAGKYIYSNFQNTDVSEDYNIFYSAGGKVVTRRHTFGAHDVMADPRFADLTSVVTSSFSSAADKHAIEFPRQAMTALGLQPNSRARNNGTLILDDGEHIDPLAENGNLDRRIDMGAISYNAR